MAVVAVKLQVGLAVLVAWVAALAVGVVGGVPRRGVSWWRRRMLAGLWRNVAGVCGAVAAVVLVVVPVRLVLAVAVAAWAVAPVIGVAEGARQRCSARRCRG